MPDVPFDIDSYTKTHEANSVTCQSGKRSVFDISKLSTCVTPDAIWDKYIPMGFEQFKLEGRTSTRLYLTETYMQYMLKPECRDEARMMFMYNMERNGVFRFED
jgi:hypothetical protein